VGHIVSIFLMTVLGKKRRMCRKTRANNMRAVNRDDWISKYKMLQHGRDTVLGHLATS
jgi:hypothetical protein